MAIGCVGGQGTVYAPADHILLVISKGSTQSVGGGGVDVPIAAELGQDRAFRIRSEHRLCCFVITDRLYGLFKATAQNGPCVCYEVLADKLLGHTMEPVVESVRLTGGNARSCSMCQVIDDDVSNSRGCVFACQGFRDVMSCGHMKKL